MVDVVPMTSATTVFCGRGGLATGSRCLTEALGSMFSYLVKKTRWEVQPGSALSFKEIKLSG